eukprot:Mrub_01187.p1 GENE.Mrub_01187~~Mrub_01187.p1  ORF type:complete len:771 (+),score=10.20 Mrub_01187:67-2313(+)
MFKDTDEWKSIDNISEAYKIVKLFSGWLGSVWGKYPKNEAILMSSRGQSYIPPEIYIQESLAIINGEFIDANDNNLNIKRSGKSKIVLIPKNGIGIYMAAELNNLCWSSVVFTIDSSNDMSECTSLIYSVVKPILVLGAGKTGRLIPEAFGGVSSCITTHRKKELCLEDCALGHLDSVLFDLADRETWINLPDTNTVIITFDLTNYDLFLDDFASSYLAKIECVIVYSSIGVHCVNKLGGIIDEDTPTSGSRLAERARIENTLSQDPRDANAGPRAVQATVLSLAGLIYYDGEDGVRNELRGFFEQGFFKSSNEIVNLVRAQDVAKITAILALSNTCKAQRLSISCGAYVVEDIAKACNVPVPKNTEPSVNSKYMDTTLIRFVLRNIYPSFEFKQILPNLPKAQKPYIVESERLINTINYENENLNFRIMFETFKNIFKYHARAWRTKWLRYNITVDQNENSLKVSVDPIEIFIAKRFFTSTYNGLTRVQCNEFSPWVGKLPDGCATRSHLIRGAWFSKYNIDSANQGSFGDLFPGTIMRFGSDGIGIWTQNRNNDNGVWFVDSFFVLPSSEEDFPNRRMSITAIYSGGVIKTVAQLLDIADKKVDSGEGGDFNVSFTPSEKHWDYENHLAQEQGSIEASLLPNKKMIGTTYCLKPDSLEIKTVGTEWNGLDSELSTDSPSDTLQFYLSNNVCVSASASLDSPGAKTVKIVFVDSRTGNNDAILHSTCASLDANGMFESYVHKKYYEC